MASSLYVVVDSVDLLRDRAENKRLTPTQRDIQAPFFMTPGIFTS